MCYHYKLLHAHEHAYMHDHIMHAQAGEAHPVHCITVINKLNMVTI